LELRERLSDFWREVRPWLDALRLHSPEHDFRRLASHQASRGQKLFYPDLVRRDFDIDSPWHIISFQAHDLPRLATELNRIHD
jgi:hypothetical protein